MIINLTAFSIIFCMFPGPGKQFLVVSFENRRVLNSFSKKFIFRTKTIFTVYNAKYHRRNRILNGRNKESFENKENIWFVKIKLSLIFNDDLCFISKELIFF
jgi:hypothetical protein